MSKMVGKQINHLLHALAGAQDWRLTQATEYVAERTGYTEPTIYRWRQGRHAPPSEALEALARIGKEKANLDRRWGRRLFHAARQSDPSLLDGIWGPEDGSKTERFELKVTADQNTYAITHRSEELAWLQKVIGGAQLMGDWAVAVEAMSDMSWNLTLMGHPDRLRLADTLLAQAWEMREAVGPVSQARLAQTVASLRVRQARLAEARRWLHTWSELLAPIAPDAGGEVIRMRIAISYWQAVIEYEEGCYEQAESLFREVVAHGQTAGWRLCALYAQNWLADIAIVRGDLDAAEHLLRSGLPLVQDERRRAFYLRSLAHVERERGNADRARRLAEDALALFERLEMQPETDRMYELLEGLDGAIRD